MNRPDQISVLFLDAAVRTEWILTGAPKVNQSATKNSSWQMHSVRNSFCWINLWIFDWITEWNMFAGWEQKQEVRTCRETDWRWMTEWKQPFPLMMSKRLQIELLKYFQDQLCLCDHLSAPEPRLWGWTLTSVTFHCIQQETVCLCQM